MFNRGKPFQRLWNVYNVPVSPFITFTAHVVSKSVVSTNVVDNNVTNGNIGFSFSFFSSYNYSNVLYDFILCYSPILK